MLPGRVVTVRTMAGLAQDKQSIGRACEARGVDMESAAIGTAAARHGIPFFVLRSISDLAEEDLPLGLSLLCQPATMLRGVWAVVTTPVVWPAFNRLRRQKNVASARLTQFFETFFLLLSETQRADEH